MTTLSSLDDIRALRETWQIECKLALGRDGTGALPHDIWETYSAFANTQGGEIFLGLRELPGGTYELAGIPNPRKVITELMTGLRDPKVVSVNLLGTKSIKVFEIEGRKLIRIKVPVAPRSLQPVYIKGDVLNGSYVRDRSYDIRMTQDRVRRVLAKVRAALINKS